MPQMSPTLWLFLSFFNMLNMFLMMIYFNSLPIHIKLNNNNNNIINNNNNNNTLQWNWMW